MKEKIERMLEEAEHDLCTIYVRGYFRRGKRVD